MKALYYLMFIGLAISFLAIIAAAIALLSPSGIEPDNTVTAIPSEVKAGTLVKYKINGCEEGKYSGVTSVNIQTTDTPPSITVAVASPSAQAIHCQNVILIPAPVPSGDYRILVFVSYSVNPIKDLLSPERRQYTSNIIHVTNENPQFQLPEALPKVEKESTPQPTPVAVTPNPQQSKPIEQQPLEDTPPYPKPEKRVVEKTVDGILSIPEVVTNTLKEIL